MDNLEDLDDVDANRKAMLSSTSYQTQECILYGSLFEGYLPDLERRLAGLCDPGSEEFHEHEMSFSLRCGMAGTPDVSIKLRRKFKSTASTADMWCFRYIGVPEPDTKCPTIVRKVINSTAYSHDMMNFAKSLGLRMDYEYMARGKLFTKGNIKVAISSLSKTDKPGHYEFATLKSVSESLLIEICANIPESSEYMTTAKLIRDFADQLMPMVYMEKVDYWKKYCSTGTIAIPPTPSHSSQQQPQSGQQNQQL